MKPSRARLLTLTLALSLTGSAVIAGTTAEATPAAVDSTRATAQSRPFSWQSSWNTPLPTSTRYTSIPWPAPSGGNYGVNWSNHSPAVHYAGSQDPVVSVTLPHSSWGYPAGTYSVRIPRGVTGAAGVDGELIVVDGDTVWNFWQFRRTSDTAASVVSLGRASATTSTGWGQRSPFRSAGITAPGASQLAGLIVPRHVTAPTIDHALQIIVDGRYNVPVPVGEAIHADGWGYQGQPGVALNEGQRLAIPRSTPMPAGLSPLGRKVFVALQTYGGFDLDSSGGMTGMRMQANAFDSATVSALNADMKKLIPLLHKVG